MPHRKSTTANRHPLIIGPIRPTLTFPHQLTQRRTQLRSQLRDIPHGRLQLFAPIRHHLSVRQFHRITTKHGLEIRKQSRCRSITGILKRIHLPSKYDQTHRIFNPRTPEQSNLTRL